jgi:hypothetical protein
MSCNKLCSDNIEIINLDLNKPDINSLNCDKIQVLLDLDNTIINSLSLNEELKLFPENEQKKFNYVDMPKYYRIFERPNLQLFLDFLFSEFDVSVYTAADKEYAIFIIKNFILRQDKPERKLKYFFHGLHSEYSEELYNSPKNLKILWDKLKIKCFSPCNTLIIDDLPDVYQNNPHNSIPAPKFELINSKNKPVYGMENDNFLLKVIKKLRNIKRNHNSSICLVHNNQHPSNIQGFNCNKKLIE